MQIYNLSSSHHITRFLAVVAKKRKIFQVNLCVKSSQHNAHTGDDNSKVNSQAFKLTLELYIFNFLSQFNSIVISN